MTAIKTSYNCLPRRPAKVLHTNSALGGSRFYMFSPTVAYPTGSLRLGESNGNDRRVPLNSVAQFDELIESFAYDNVFGVREVFKELGGNARA